MATIAEDQVLVETLLRLGDDSLILGQRLGEWCGHAPSVEVDLSLANMGLDLIGQATHFLGCAGESREGQRRRRARLPPRRARFPELPPGRAAQRRFRPDDGAAIPVLDLAGNAVRPSRGSANETIAAIAAKAVKEVRYHAELAAEWVIRLGDGTAESRRRMEEGLDWMWRFIPELFEMDVVATEAAERGIGADVASFREDYDARIGVVLAEATLEAPADQRPILGGRRGHHSEHLGHLIAVMQFLPHLSGRDMLDVISTDAIRQVLEGVLDPAYPVVSVVDLGLRGAALRAFHGALPGVGGAMP